MWGGLLLAAVAGAAALYTTNAGGTRDRVDGLLRRVGVIRGRPTSSSGVTSAVVAVAVDN